MAVWPNKSTDAYIRDLQHEQSRTRRQAAAALEVLADGCAVESLIATLNDENRDVRANAARALGKIGGPHAVEPLITRLRDPESTVRAIVIQALWRIGDSRAIAPLIPLLRDPDQLVRYFAARALIHPYDLHRQGSPTAVPLIEAHGAYADVYHEANTELHRPFGTRREP